MLRKRYKPKTQPSTGSNLYRDRNFIRNLSVNRRKRAALPAQTYGLLYLAADLRQAFA